MSTSLTTIDNTPTPEMQSAPMIISSSTSSTSPQRVSDLHLDALRQETTKANSLGCALTCTTTDAIGNFKAIVAHDQLLLFAHATNDDYPMVRYEQSGCDNFPEQLRQREEGGVYHRHHNHHFNNDEEDDDKSEAIPTVPTIYTIKSEEDPVNTTPACTCSTYGTYHTRDQLVNSPSSLLPLPTPQHHTQKASAVIMHEVLYSDGATPLFRAIEDEQWQKAYDIALESPMEVSTWVNSTGTLHTTFGWSIWRRLPIHEACRRDAPLWLVTRLVQIYPLGCRQVTQFGEVPLHVAVKSGASPPIVNCLVSNYYLAIVANDQSGRTPLQIAQEAEIVNIDHHAQVVDMLTRAHAVWDEWEDVHADHLEQHQAKHLHRLVSIKQHHDEVITKQEIDKKQMQQESIQIHAVLASTQRTVQEQQQEIDILQNKQIKLNQEIEEIKEKLRQSHGQYKHSCGQVKSQKVSIHEKDEQIRLLKQEINDLHVVLQRLVQFSRYKIQERVQSTQIKLQTFLHAWDQTKEELDFQHDELRNLLQELGVAELPQSPSPHPDHCHFYSYAYNEDTVNEDDDAVLHRDYNNDNGPTPPPPPTATTHLVGDKNSELCITFTEEEENLAVVNATYAAAHSLWMQPPELPEAGL